LRSSSVKPGVLTRYCRALASELSKATTAEKKSPPGGDDEVSAGEDDWPAEKANGSRTTIGKTARPRDIQKRARGVT
jgi:hypothetical protein